MSDSQISAVDEDAGSSAYLPHVAEIVSAYVSHNSVRANEVGDLISSVHAALTGMMSPSQVEAEAPAPIVPAVSVKKSLTDDAITCMVCGKTFKSLRRHLSADHDLTADSYRQMLGLRADYPMVAPSYSATRSALAKSIGLGNFGVKARTKTDQPKKRGRPAKAA